jgi:hydrogenase maturation protein HypF
MDEDLELVEVQHHRAHLAAVLADNHWPPDAGPVLGVALDGSGFGDDGSIWGGEWLVGDYRGLDRVACLKRVALPGGTQAILEPWRSLFAQIEADIGWPAFQQRFAGLELTKRLQARPVQVLSAMIERGVNSPLTTSAGRLFDAVAAAVGVCADRIAYEGQAAIELEALCSDLRIDEGYPFAVVEQGGLRVLDPGPLWRQLFADLADGLASSQIAARFHIGFADAVVRLSIDIASTRGLGTVALSGGVFQNRTLFERVTAGLRAGGLEVLSHRRVPTNDGGLALGQAATAAALMLSPSS